MEAVAFESVSAVRQRSDVAGFPSSAFAGC
jgi:hypothetical protein